MTDYGTLLHKADWTEAKLLQALAHLPSTFCGGYAFRAAAIRVTGKQAHGETLRKKLLERGWVVGRCVHGKKWCYTVKENR